MPSRTLLFISGVVLAVPIIVPLLVWTYAKEAPELGGIPFFFWYQFLLIVLSVAFTSIAYVLVGKHDAQRRAYERSQRKQGGAA